MAFIFESQHLDLQKKYLKFDYKSLIEEEAPKLNDSEIAPIINQGESENTNDGINQNQYLLLQEKDLILHDLKNIHFFCKEHIIKNLDLSTLQINESKEEQVKEIEKNFPFALIKNRICYVIQKYQEQPALLDPIVEEIVSPIMQLVEEYLILCLQARLSDFKVINYIHELINLIYILCKVRGFKFVNKFFPHEVKDLEPVLYYLVKQRNNDTEIWETKYILILWLSIIILVPFDLSTIDSKLTSLLENIKTTTIYDNLLDIMKFYLNSSTKTRDSASVFLAHFFSRPDIQKTTLLNNYLQWAKKTISDLENDPFHSFYVTGVYHSLVEIFKIGQRNEILDKIPNVFTVLFPEESEEGGGNEGKKPTKSNPSTTLRHLKCKLAQRIALQYLKPRINQWAYKRNSNSLVENFQKSNVTSKLQTNVVNTVTENKDNKMMSIQQKVINNIEKQEGDEEEDDEYMDDVDVDHIEKIIDFLTESLRDKDTVVRWSAAKGLGRITQRLDQELADDIVKSILDLFTPNGGDYTWHGGCLAVGELCRRGLLLPEKLKIVFPILFKALLFDQNQGNYSVGAHVRDSACYVAWAFARAYEPSLIKDHMLSLAQHLLIVSLFDREVNCRRAAAAAFQEHVGRQGTFPHGIDILTEADYFTLGIRTNAYLKVSPFVGYYEEYFTEFVDHLAQTKLKNWDPEVRKLSAATLNLFSPINPEYMGKVILPRLVDLCLNESILVRHGAIYGVSEIILGLSGQCDQHCCANIMKDSIFMKSLSKNERKLIKAGEYMSIFKEKYETLKQKNNFDVVEKETLTSILDLVGKIDKARLYRGKGGEIMRIAVCRLIQCISYANIKLSNLQIKKYLSTLDECITKPLEDVQTSAELGLTAFSHNYHNSNKNEFNAFLTKLLSKASKDPNVAITRGYTRALSSLSLVVLKDSLDKVFACLEDNCKIKLKDLDDADTRKFAISSYQSIICNIIDLDLQEDSGEEIIMNSDILDKFFKIAAQLMNDYTTDKRGDIGSMVREASMFAMRTIFQKISSLLKQGVKNEKLKNSLKLNSDTVHLVIALMLKQLSEKIDRTRLVAGSILQELVDKYFDELPEFPHKTQIYNKFNKTFIQNLLSQEQKRLETDYSLTEEMKANAFQTISTQEVTFNDVNLNNQDAFVYYWNLPHCVYPLIIQFLEYPEYSYYILSGIIISVGGLTESISKHSYQSLMSHVDKISKDDGAQQQIKALFGIILEVFERNADDERVIVPLFKTIERLLEREEILEQRLILSDQLVSIYSSIIKEISKSKSIQKLVTGIAALVGLLRFDLSVVSAKALSHSVKIMMHKFPMVRKQFIDKLYFYLMMSGDAILGEDLNEKIKCLLTESDWFEMNTHELNERKEELTKTFDEFISALNKSQNDKE